MGETPTARWPGSPDSAWDAAARSRGAGSRAARPRPAAPPWRDLDDFVRHVQVSRPHVGGAVVLAFFGVFVAVYAAILFADPLPATSGHFALAAGPLLALMPWSGYAATAVAIWLIGRSVVVFWRGRSDRLSTLRDAHERALATGFVAYSYATSFSAPADSGYVPVALLIDSRLSDATAQRIHRATDAWLGRVVQDDRANHEARALFGSRTVVPFTEVFGPEADGAWFVRLFVGDAQHWQLVIPGPGEPGPSSPADVYAMR